MISTDIDKVTVKGFIEDLDKYYPDIIPWFDGLAVNERSPMIVYKIQNKPVGICIGKNSPEEKKIRCVRVLPEHQHMGIGIRLIEGMMEILEERKPLATVSEELLHQYSRVFVRRYGFSLDSVVKGLYRPRKLEYIFNQG